MVLNLKASSISAATSLRHRVELPRGTDAVGDVLDLMADLADSEEVEILVIEVENAYWQVPK